MEGPYTRPAADLGAICGRTRRRCKAAESSDIRATSASEVTEFKRVWALLLQGSVAEE
jgi:hypothetical protein